MTSFNNIPKTRHRGWSSNRPARLWISAESSNHHRISWVPNRSSKLQETSKIRAKTTPSNSSNFKTNKLQPKSLKLAVLFRTKISLSNWWATKIPSSNNNTTTRCSRWRASSSSNSPRTFRARTISSSCNNSRSRKPPRSSHLTSSSRNSLPLSHSNSSKMTHQAQISIRWTSWISWLLDPQEAKVQTWWAALIISSSKPLEEFKVLWIK